MKGFKKKQFCALLDEKYKTESSLVTLESVQRLFYLYGDDYYRDYGGDSKWELVKKEEALSGT